MTDRRRRALVRGVRTLREAEAYLPGNYEVVGHFTEPFFSNTRRDVFVIAGHDSAGWTLDEYVIPRYASGLISCEEIFSDPDYVGTLARHEKLAVLAEVSPSRSYDDADDSELADVLARLWALTR